MDIFFKDNLNSSDQLYIEQLLCASMAASTDNTGSWGITPALQIYWMLTAGGLQLLIRT